MTSASLASPRADTMDALQMRASVLREAGRPTATEMIWLDPPGPDEVLVAVAAAGVCHSDVHLADGLLGAGRWPIVLGHEGAGVVQAVGERVTAVSVGDHVVFSFVASLGGSISAEHGIGALKARWLPLVRSDAERALFARLRAAFDPAGILNPYVLPR